MALDPLELAEEWALHIRLRRDAIREVGERFALATNASGGHVVRIRLTPPAVAGAVDEVRARLRGTDVDECTWWCGPRAQPADLADRLEDAGLRPHPTSPVLTALVLDHEPSGSPAVEVRRVETLEDFLVEMELGMEAWSVPARLRERERARARETWADVGRRGRRHYLAYIDGEPVAYADSFFLEGAVLLNAAATLPHARGKGAYTSLVHARWRDAADAGTPQLVIAAGPMSSPILEHLGFKTLGTIRLLLDRLQP